MTVQGRVYHYLGALIPPERIKLSYASVYVHDIDEIERATIRGNNVWQQLNQNILVDLGAAILQNNTYAQTFHSLQEWARRDRPNDYRMIIHADKRPLAEHARRYNNPQTSEVAAIIPGAECGEVGNRDIVLHKRGRLNSRQNQVLDKIPSNHRSNDPLSYVCSSVSRRQGWMAQRNVHGV